MRALNIGCGPSTCRGFAERGTTFDATEIGIDLNINTKPDVVADMRAIPFEDESFDGVIASHVLEHVPIWDVQPALIEMKRVLSAEGTLCIHVPDMNWIAKLILKSGLKPRLIPIIYGNPGQIGWSHQMGFDTPLLVASIRLAGFRETSVVTQEVGVSWWGPDDPEHKGPPIRTDQFREIKLEAKKRR